MFTTHIKVNLNILMGVQRSGGWNVLDENLKNNHASTMWLWRLGFCWRVPMNFCCVDPVLAYLFIYMKSFANWTLCNFCPSLKMKAIFPGYYQNQS